MTTTRPSSHFTLPPNSPYPSNHQIYLLSPLCSIFIITIFVSAFSLNFPVQLSQSVHPIGQASNPLSTSKPADMIMLKNSSRAPYRLWCLKCTSLLPTTELPGHSSGSAPCLRLNLDVISFRKSSIPLLPIPILD